MRRILVVDDSMTMRALYRQILSHIARTSLTFAADGVQALECVERSEPHLMFLDINMPRMNGLEVLKELGARGVLVRTAVVLVSTEGKDDDLRRGRDAGASEYLRKPFAMNALAPIVERLIPEAETATMRVTEIGTETAAALAVAAGHRQ
jgi:CheY-like chemotaxis protein